MLPFRLIYKLVLIVVLTQVILDSNYKGYAQADKIPIGVIFDKNTEEIQNAFKYAMMQYSNKPSHLDFQVFVDVISTADAFKLSRLICNQFARGVIAMMGAVSPDSFDTFHSYTNTFQIPFLTPWFPEKVLRPTSGLPDYALSMRPDYHMAIIETIAYYGWKHVIYIYHSHDGLLRLQQLYQSFQPGKAAFRITHVKRVTNASDVVNYLVSIEKLDRWCNKYVVLDSTSEMAKETIILHVKDVHLGRRNYHYFLSGLVLDDSWDKEISEFGAINITGFRVLDYSRKFVRDFFNASRWNSISAKAALMYDSVQVLVDSIQRLMKKKPDLIHSAMQKYVNNNTSKVIDCNPKDKISPFEHGDKISRMIRKTEIEGLTGVVKFNEAGHRKNFSLQIMEFTIKSNMVKVGTWHENTGFVPVDPKPPQNETVALYDREKTYIITTILEAPYVMKNNNDDPNVITKDLFTGFVVDLAKALMEKMDIKYEIRVVKDGKYGEPNPEMNAGWDGIIGELIREEADLAIAPLTYTVEREAVVDFTIPFLSFISKPKRQVGKQALSIFAFLKPLSMEIWICIILSLLGASIVLYLVSRFSPYECRRATNMPQAADNTGVARNPKVVNGFGFWNSLWFAVSSLLQQGSFMTPRSMSGRIVTTVWWTFTFVFVSLYTANMSSYLTLLYLSEPTSKYERIAACPEDPAGLRIFGNSPPITYNQPSDEPCELLITTKTLGIQNFAIALPKNSKLRAGINIALQTMIDEGSLQSFIRKWFTKHHRTLSIQEDNFALTLSETAGIFYILTGGLILALGITFMEYLYYRIWNTVDTYGPQTEVLQAPTSRPGPRTSPECTPQHDHSYPGWNRGDFPGFYVSANQHDQEESATYSQV